MQCLIIARAGAFTKPNFTEGDEATIQGGDTACCLVPLLGDSGKFKQANVVRNVLHS